MTRAVSCWPNTDEKSESVRSNTSSSAALHKYITPNNKTIFSDPNIFEFLSALSYIRARFFAVQVELRKVRRAKRGQGPEKYTYMMPMMTLAGTALADSDWSIIDSF